MTAPARDRSAVIGRILVVYCLLLSLAVVWVVLFPPPPYDVHRPDFGVFWVVSGMLPDRPDLIYDARAVTEAQAFIADASLGLFPWVYPPTALGLVWPFSALPFWTAYAIWVAATAAGYLLVVHRVVREATWQVLALLLASFSFWVAARAGQLALFVSMLAILGVAVLRTRPVLGGVLLAAVGLVKPSLMVLAPVALIAGGHWRALVAAGATTLAAIGWTLALFGAGIWEDWLAALRTFPDLLVELGIETHGVTLRSLLTELGIFGTPGTVLHVLGGLAGVVLSALIFRRTDALAARLVGLVGCGLMLTPYAMKYDLLILLPVAGWLLARPKRTALDWWLAIVAFGLFFPIPPLAGAVTVVFVTSVSAAALTGRLGAIDGTAPDSRADGHFSLASGRPDG